MINKLEKISTDEMLLNWARAEAASVRRLPYLKTFIGEELLSKMARGEQLNKEESRVLIEMIQNTRGELLDGLLSLNITWHKGMLPYAEISELMIMNWKPFVDLAPSRKLMDLVRALERGDMPPRHHEFQANLERIKGGFSFEKMVGTPVLVSESVMPPYTLVEGFTRLSALLLNGKYIQDITVILGVDEGIVRWKYY